MSAVLIVLIVFGFVTFIVKMGLEHERQSRSPAERALTTSELRRMISESVEDATQELRDRMERMERQLGSSPERPALPPAREDEDPPFSSRSWENDR